MAEVYIHYSNARDVLIDRSGTFMEDLAEAREHAGACVEAGLRDAIRHNDVARPSRIGPAETVQDGRKSILKMFKEFFAQRPTAH